MSFFLAYFTMLFEFMYIHWCPTRFPYHMMFVSFFSNTAGASRRAGVVYAFWVPPFIVVVLCFLDHLYVFFLLAFVWSVLYGFWALLWYLQTFLLALTFRFPLLSRHIFTTLLVCLQTLIFTSFLLLCWDDFTVIHFVFSLCTFSSLFSLCTGGHHYVFWFDIRTTMLHLNIFLHARHLFDKPVYCSGLL